MELVEIAMIFEGPIEIFFKSPTESPSAEGDCILYHLRSDLEKLYGKEGNLDINPYKNTMLSMMGILAGIDYLSQVYSTEKKSGNQFVQLGAELGGLNKDEAEALYQLRCAIMHSVSLTTISARSVYRKGSKYIFNITDDHPCKLIIKQSEINNEVTYKVSFLGLKKFFKDIIDKLSNICNGTMPHQRSNQILNSICIRSSEKLIKR